jgi:hypothetical protein
LSDWPGDALAVLERAEKRHGGAARFARVASVRAHVEHLGGPLPRLKGLGKTWSPPTEAVVSPRARRVAFLGMAAGEVIFENGDMRLVGPDGGVTESRDHRPRMPRGRWSPVDAAYFFGYALVTYFSLPFLLRACGYIGRRRWRDLDGLTVEFPPGFPTHSRVQSFFFDAEGLLRRHDYTADVVGKWATGAHFSDGYVEAGGLVFATGRRVVATVFGRPTPIPVLDARLGGFELREE